MKAYGIVHMAVGHTDVESACIRLESMSQYVLTGVRPTEKKESDLTLIATDSILNTTLSRQVADQPR